MGAINSSFLFDVESRMQILTESAYSTLNKNLWWDKIAKRRTSGSRKEIVTWLLSTAMIRSAGKKGGNITFDDIVSQYTEFENVDAAAGLKLKVQQLSDSDGGGLDLAAQWSKDIGAYMAYWPQKSVSTLIKNGHSSGYNAYDGLTFFNTAHKLNPYKASAGTYKNLWTSSDAADISTAVSADTALANLGLVCAKIRSIYMPNGVDPRNLVPKYLIVPPKLAPRAAQLTNAKFIAQAASSGGGGADIEAIVKYMGFGLEPIVSAELANFESETTYFIGCEQLDSSELGAFTYIDREPFSIKYYTGRGGGDGVDAMLDRLDELEWHCKGRNVAGYGHPFLFHKVKAS